MSEEVTVVRFTVRCPVDGVVEVHLEDVDSIVVRSGSDIEVIFECPCCGQHIPTRGQMPPALKAMLNGSWMGIDPREQRVYGLSRSGSRPAVPTMREDRPHIESYVEYFRRELDEADTVEAMLAEMDPETTA